MVLTLPLPPRPWLPRRPAHRHRGPVPLGPSKWLQEALDCEDKPTRPGDGNTHEGASSSPG